MVTTSRKFALIIRSRAAASPFLIFFASSISCRGVKRGNCPISRKYLVSPKSLSFMSRSYSMERFRRYSASVGFSNTAREVLRALSFEIKDLADGGSSNSVARADLFFTVSVRQLLLRSAQEKCEHGQSERQRQRPEAELHFEDGP